MQGNRHIRHRSDEGYDGRGVVWGQTRSAHLLRGIRSKAGRGSKPGFRWEAWGWEERPRLAGSVAFRSVPECPVLGCGLAFQPGCS